MKSVPVFYSPSYVAAGHTFDTTRKAAWVAASVAADPIPGIELRAPRSLTEAELGLPAVDRAFASLPVTPRFDLCLYNAGMDPHEDCPEGGLSGITAAILAARETFVFEWCRARGVPVAFVLAGGYLGPRLQQRDLVGLHRVTLAAAADHARSEA